jgi:3-oxocholest-4-en-26-oate---CoA ligase
MEFNLADLFECVANHVPEREALVCGDQRLTFRALDERSTQLAHGLAGLGIGTGDHVGLYLYNGVEFVEAMLACYKLRAVPVNVNYRYVAEELAYLFDDADLVAVVYHRELGSRIAAIAERPAQLRSLIEVDDDRALDVELGPLAPVRYEELLASGSARRDFEPRSADDRYVLYTGGTTGLPKGVVWRQEDIFFATMGGGNPGLAPIERPDQIGPAVLANRAQRVAPFLAPDDPGPLEYVSLALGPLIHASGQWSALGTLLGGGKVVLSPHRQMDLDHVVELIERERVVALNLVGDTSGRPLLGVLEARPGASDTSSLLLLGSGGSILSGDIKDRLMAELPSVLAIVDGIGSSEVPAHAVAVVTRGAATPPSLSFAPKAETVVLDDDLTPVAPGSGRVGRLATRGRVPLGYYKDPAKSAQTFVEIDGTRWAVPGDMATVEADGTIRLLGRGSMCINTGGEKVYPEEVEAVLKTHPQVADAVVVGAGDDRFGERVTALVQPSAAGDPPRLETLRAHCRGRLAAYKAPRSLRLVDEVQRSPAGKPDYHWARQVVTESEGEGGRSA